MTATATIETSREAWLEARRSGIGASDAAAIIGVSPWKSALELYAEKLAIVDMPSAESEAMEWGNALEEPIAARYRRETQREVIDPGRWTIQRSDAHPFMLATLDRRIVDPVRGEGLLEIKTTGFRGDAWATEAPLHVEVQVQHQMAVTGYTWGSIAVLIAGQKFLWLDIERNDAFIDAMIARESEFWDRVQRHDPPEPDASESCRELLKRLYPRESQGKTIALPADAAEWEEQRRAAKAAIEGATEAVRAAENRLIAALGDAEVGILPDGARLTYKAQTRKGYTVEEKTFRVLRRSAAK